MLSVGLSPHHHPRKALVTEMPRDSAAQIVQLKASQEGCKVGGLPNDEHT